VAIVNIAIIGLGKMGEAIAFRAIKAQYKVFGFDINQEICASAEKIGVTIADSIAAFAHKNIHVFWLMVPQGPLVDHVIAEIKKFACDGDIIIDGGNSKFTDSLRRAKELSCDRIFFLDCGTSGGIHGKTNGFCLMIGGKEEAYEKLFPLFSAVAMPNGHLLVGPSGTGHYVKMIHNGIEYGILQAYAEGFHLLKEGEFKNEALNLEKIANVWNHGSVIRSWILELVEDAMKEDQSLETISGKVASTGMGEWTVERAEKSNIPVPVIKTALQVRKWSEETNGNYATKLIAILRNKFGGHSVIKK
jgi:6-phosphogluconate dehydrogenase